MTALADARREADAILAQGSAHARDMEKPVELRDGWTHPGAKAVVLAELVRDIPLDTSGAAV